MKDEIFIALTNDQECWDFKKKIIFIEEWYIPCTIKYFNNFKYDIFDKDGNCIERKKTQQFSLMFYKELLPIVCKILNRFHKKKYSHKYWNLMLIPWLYPFVLTMFIKYTLIRGILDEYNGNNVYVNILKEENFKLLNNVGEYNKKYRDDFYNFQLYSRVIKYLEKIHPINYSEIIYSVKNVNKHKNKFHKKIFTKLKKLKYKSIKNIINLIKFKILLKKYNNKDVKIALFKDGFSKLLHSRLILKSKGKIIQVDFPKVVEKNSFKNQYIRNYLKLELIKDCSNYDDFKKFLVEILFDEIPISFIENFEDITMQAESLKSFNPSIILSQSGWFEYDTLFPYWVAIKYDQGATLMGMQHGGNYCIDKDVGIIELNTMDIFYTWGITGKINDTKLIGTSPYRMSNYKIMNASNNLKNILYVNGGIHPYRGYDGRCMISGIKYFSNEVKFLSRLEEDIFKNLIVRDFSVDYCWNFKKRLLKKFKNLKFDNYYDENGIKNDCSFYSALEKAKIVVCDHLSTTWVEALLVNKPIILFWNEDYYDIYPEEKKYFKMLEKVGVLHYIPEDAAKIINNIYYDVENWWNDEERRKVINLVQNRFAQRFEKVEDWWVDELTDYLKGDNGIE